MALEDSDLFAVYKPGDQLYKLSLYELKKALGEISPEGPPPASELEPGLVKLATAQNIINGSNGVAMTPGGLRAALNDKDFLLDAGVYAAAARTVYITNNLGMRFTQAYADYELATEDKTGIAQFATTEEVNSDSASHVVSPQNMFAAFLSNINEDDEYLIYDGVNTGSNADYSQVAPGDTDPDGAVTSGEPTEVEFATIAETVDADNGTTDDPKAITPKALMGALRDSSYLLDGGTKQLDADNYDYPDP